MRVGFKDETLVTFRLPICNVKRGTNHTNHVPVRVVFILSDFYYATYKTTSLDQSNWLASCVKRCHRIHPEPSYSWVPQFSMAGAEL
jgi:hypothetical protein